MASSHANSSEVPCAPNTPSQSTRSIGEARNNTGILTTLNLPPTTAATTSISSSTAELTTKTFPSIFNGATTPAPEAPKRKAEVTYLQESVKRLRSEETQLTHEEAIAAVKTANFTEEYQKELEAGNGKLREQAEALSLWELLGGLVLTRTRGLLGRANDLIRMVEDVLLISRKAGLIVL